MRSKEWTKMKKAMMLEALESTMGVITPAAKKVGIDRDTHRNWIKNDAEYARKVDDLGEIKKDFIESNIYKRIEMGSDFIIWKMAERFLKDRGYGVNKLEEENGIIKIEIKGLTLEDDEEEDDE